jgi:hypothetical protein
MNFIVKCNCFWLEHALLFEARLSKILLDLTFTGPCIVIYYYNKINEMHYFSNLFLE